MDAFADAFFASDLGGRGFPFSAWRRKGASPYLYHWHDDMELICVTKGSLTVSTQKEYRLKEGDILLVPCGEPHCLFVGEGECERIVVRFSMQMVKPYLEEHAENLALAERIALAKKYSCDWPEESRARMYTIVERLYAEHTENKDGGKLAVRALLFELVLMILREIPVEEVRESGRRANQVNNFKRAIHYLAAHYTEDISLQDCADAMDLNMNYFSRFFRAQTGINFHEYLTTLRLKKAEHLLLTTGISVTEVVQQSGFQNVKTFNRVFKKAHDCSPREFRRGSKKA